MEIHDRKMYESQFRSILKVHHHHFIHQKLIIPSEQFESKQFNSLT